MRFAVVMYGGVSLAVYIYGAALELLELVKATAPADRSAETGLAFPEVDGTARVYRRLGQLAGSLPGEHPAEDAPVRARFVVDILSGTSAGGLNGICLAAALAGDVPGSQAPALDALERLWLDEGDIGRLVADEESTWRYGDDGLPVRGETGAAVVDERLAVGPAASLLNARRLLAQLADALGSLAAEPDETEPCRSRLVDELDLWVTATDLGGRTVQLPLANGSAGELDHGVRFHFRYDRREQRNDFTREDAPFLAFAGRCTSSFPGAFEPMRLRTLPPHWPLEDAWSRFLEDYREAQPAFDGRALSDGGILDNKPFSYATESLSRRRAALPVDRKLLYVEPDPSEPAVADLPWDALQTAQAATLGIPRKETIRRDIETVLRRNLAVERAKEVLTLAGMTGGERPWLSDAALEDIPKERWQALSLEETLAARGDALGPTYATYHRLKVREVVDYLAECLALALGIDPERPEALALRAVVRAWKESRYAESGQGEGPPASENRFLFLYDLPYRARRLAFVLARLRELEQGDEAATRRALASAGVLLERLPDPAGPDRWSAFRPLRRAIDDALSGLWSIDPRAPALGLAESLAAYGITREWLAELAAIDGDRARVRAAAARVPDVSTEELFPPIERLREAIERVAIDASAIVESERGLGPPLSLLADEGRLPDPTVSLEACLRYVGRFHHDAFETFDLVLLPLSFETSVASTNAIDVFRVSPIGGRAPDGVTETDLLGAGIGHFAAFFDRDWRRHDIAWGRLNAAETLIRSVLGDDDPRADGLIREAHEAIVAEYRAQSEAAGLAVDEASGRLGGVGLRAQPAREPTVRMLERAGVVTSTLVGELVRARSSSPATAGADGALPALTRELLTRSYSLPRATAEATRILFRRLPAAARWALALVVALEVVLIVLATVGGQEWATWAAVVLGSLLAGVLLVVLAEIVVLVRTIRGAVLKQVSRILGP